LIVFAAQKPQKPMFRLSAQTHQSNTFFQ
jgi:hypothetical protein